MDDRQDRLDTPPCGEIVSSWVLPGALRGGYDPPQSRLIFNAYSIHEMELGEHMRASGEPRRSESGRVIIPRKDVATLWGYSRTTSVSEIPELEPASEPGGGFYLEDVVRAFAARRGPGRPKRDSSEPSLSEKMNLAKLRKLEADARKAELEADKVAGTLVDAAEVERDVAKMGADTMIRLQQIPPSLAPVLVGMEREQIQAALSAAINDALEELVGGEAHP